MVAWPVVSMGLRTTTLLGLGLPMIALTLRLLRVSEEEHLIAGSFFALAYALLASPLLHWLFPTP